jgi:hypothetical protein
MTTKSLVEQLKAELMEQYGLKEDQIQLELRIYPDTKKHASEILSSFETKYPKRGEHFQFSEVCSSVYSTDFHNVVAFLEEENKNEGKDHFLSI